MQLYTVSATLPLSEVDAYVSWLDKHINEVLIAGALEASIIVYSPVEQAQQVETQYKFADRSAFDLYEQHHAPSLREEGRRLFAAKPGVTFTRRLGTICCQRSR